MNQSKQPEALRLAAELVEPIDGFQEPTTLEAAAASELRRLHQHELAQIEWLEKTEWVQKSARPSELGKRRADVISARIAEKDAEICRLHARVQELEEHQAQRAPLTDSEIESATGAKQGTPLFLAAKGFAIAIERVHGIGKETK